MNTVKLTLSIFLVGFTWCRAAQKLSQRPFPQDFFFGVGTSAYQVEGAWNVSGKGVSIWDTFTHEHPFKIDDHTNGDIACDSYNKIPTDVKMLQNLGVQYYRFSLSWPRIMPTGYINQTNPEGINHYNKLINELLAKGIKPFVTIYHWDIPQTLQDLGGWTNPAIADNFVDFADLVFEKFGDRVKFWTTFNEPKQFCKVAYGDGVLAPGFTMSGDLDYKCTATVLVAHARAYDLYKRKYKETQNGKVGFTIDTFWYYPGSNSTADKAAADRLFDFFTGIFTNPIYGSGDFPDVVKQFVAERSKQQGFPTSRLPELSSEDVKLIKGSFDFFGVNFYTAIAVEDVPPYPLMELSWNTDARVNVFYEPLWPRSASPWLRVTPWSLKLVLKDLKKRYGDLPFIITENGVSDLGFLTDYNRANYILTHLNSILDSIYENNVKVLGYFYWSLMDNFEWSGGYRQHFGLYSVNFKKADRPRTPKFSASVFSDVVKHRKLPRTTVPRGRFQNVRLT